MDGLDIFRKLTRGVRFDFKRFGAEAQKLKILPHAAIEPKEKALTNAVHQGNGTERTVDKITPQTASRKRKRCGNQRDTNKARNGVLPGEISSASNLTGEDQNQSEKNGVVADEDERAGEDQELRLIGNVKLSFGATGDSALRQRKKNNRKKQRLVPEKVSMMNQERVNEIRNKRHIHVQGADVPEPLISFDLLQSTYKINPRILLNVKSAGFEVPTPIEMQAMPVMLQRRELMACASTGSGKTLAFVLPILHELREPSKQGIRALVLAPTRELARQTYEEFCRMSDGLSLRVHLIHKTAEYEKHGRKAFAKCDIVVATPNRLLYLLSHDPPLISLNSVQWLVIDESDKLFEDGKTGFRDQLATIYKACDSATVRRAMFSATFSSEVENWCILNLDNVIQVDIGARNAATDTIAQSLLYVGDESGKLLALRDIIRKGFKPPVLVFVQSKERAKELFHELMYDGINVDVIHADLTESQRDNSFASLRSGKIWVLIGTDVMGRGMDFKTVNLVINYDFPNSAVTYIHRIGRTGRAGRSGTAITFFVDEDAVNLRSIVNVMRGAGCEVPEYMLNIKPASRKLRKKLAKSSTPRETISTDIRKKARSAKEIARLKERTIKKKLKKKKVAKETKPVST